MAGLMAGSPLDALLMTPRRMMLDVCGQCNVSKKSGGIETSPNES
jgi:hypothetical protein